MFTVFVILIPIFLVTAIIEGLAAIPDLWYEHKQMSLYKRKKWINWR